MTPAARWRVSVIWPLSFSVWSRAMNSARLAATLAVERGLKVLAVVHDALLVECDECDLKEVELEARRCMREASELVLFGFVVNVDVKEIWPVSLTHPKRCMGKGAGTWLEVMKMLGLK